MRKISNGMFFLLVLLLMVLCNGCTSIPEPAFFTEESSSKTYSKVERIKYKKLSNESAEAGWRYLYRYFNKNSFVPVVNRSYIADAMRNFNYCWSFDNDNYQAYWGAGVVRGVQATFAEDKKLTEKYLKQSVEFLLLAKEHNVPPEQINKLNLDLANTYNGLGCFYLRIQKKKELANVNFERACVLLLDVIKKNPKNGRAYFLLAATYFYQNKFDKAKDAVKKAQSNHFLVPEDFLKELKKVANLNKC